MLCEHLRVHDRGKHDHDAFGRFGSKDDLQGHDSVAAHGWRSGAPRAEWHATTYRSTTATLFIVPDVPPAYLGDRACQIGVGRVTRPYVE